MKADIQSTRSSVRASANYSGFGLVWHFYGTSAQKRPLVPRVRLNFVCCISSQITLYHA
jgi:hypothetical protein